MTPTVKVTGINELRKALSRLPVELQRASETTALREGMKPVLKSARSNAGRSKGSKLLQKSIGLTVRKGRRGITARVGARTGFKKSLGMKIARKTKGKRVKGQLYEAFQDPTKYAHLVEYGTSHSAAKPFIRPAIDSNANAINEGLAKGYEKGLAKAVAKVKSGI